MSGAPSKRGELRVFHLIKGLGRGGAEMLLVEGLRCADRSRFTHGYGYFLPWKDALVPVLEEQGAEVRCFAKRNNASILLSVRQVAAFLRDWNTDVLHCHMPMAGVVGRIAGRLAGVPVVYSEHNRMERFHPLIRRLSIATWRWQRRAIAVSADVEASIRAHVASPGPVHVVLNGINVESFRRERVDRADARRQLGIPVDAPVVGTVAVFRKQKKLDDWLAAARRIVDALPESRFVLVGDGPLRQQLAAESARLELNEAVHFVGIQADVRPYVAAMDVFMMSSVFEGLPVALLEAMALESAIVCTAVGGIPEVIEDGANGRLVEPRRPDRLAAAALDLLRSAQARARFGAAARETVHERFGMRRMAAELESIYEEVIAEHRSLGSAEV